MRQFLHIPEINYDITKMLKCQMLIGCFFSQIKKYTPLLYFQQKKVKAVFQSLLLMIIPQMSVQIIPFDGQQSIESVLYQ